MPILLRRWVKAISAAMTLILVASLAPVVSAAETMNLSFGAPSRTVIDHAPAGSSVGDLTITTGDVLDASTGKRIGYYTTNQVTVRADAVTRREIRRVDLSISLKEGSIFAVALIRATEGAPPSQTMRFAVVGGTGDYDGARGSLTHGPVANQANFAVQIRLIAVPRD